MTQLLDGPMTAGATCYPNGHPVAPGAQDAQDFYLQGLEPPPRQIKIQPTGPDGSLRMKWLAAYVEEHVNALLRLRAGWDGYRARPLSYEAVASAIGVLFGVAGELSVPPQLFPLPDGGLQLEWHAGQSVEIEVDAIGDAHVLATDQTGAIVLNEDLVPGDELGLARLRRAILDLSARLAGAR